MENGLRKAQFGVQVHEECACRRHAGVPVLSQVLLGIKGVELLSCGKEELGGRERSTSCMSPWQWVQLHSLGFAMTGI